MAWGMSHSIIFGIIILGLFGSVQIAFADTPHFLTTGTGEGTLTVGVDGYGVFGGFIIGPDSANAVFEPVGSSAKDTTVHSGVAIRTIDQNNIVTTTFLTSGDIFGSGLLPTLTVTGTPTMATSSFTHLGLEFNLLQTVILTASGTTLTQTYTITNLPTMANPLGGPAKAFSLFRYFDGDLLYANSNLDIDGGGRLVLDGTEILFETDVVGTSSQDNSFIGITAEGGTDAADRFEISSFPSLGQGIVAGVDANGEILLDNMISGDTNMDGFIDGAGYDVTLGLRNEFSLAVGETTVYVTKTVFGSGAPEDVEIDPPIELVGGIILPIDTVALLIAGAQFNAFFILSTLALTGSFAFGVLYYKTKRVN